MKTPKILFLSLFIFVLAVFSYKVTYSLFSDTGSSTSNTFTAAAVFATPTPAPPTLKISEVQITASGAGNTDHDFVEFYNPTSSPFDLNGHRLVKRTGSSSVDSSIKSWTLETLVPAHGYYLWASSHDSSFPASIGADTSTTDTIAASNSIALRNGSENTGAIVDALSWNSASQSLKEGTEFSPDPGDNQSMERKALSTSTSASMAIGGIDEIKGNGFDSNDNSTDFVLRLVSQPQNSSSAIETP